MPPTPTPHVIDVFSEPLWNMAKMYPASLLCIWLHYISCQHIQSCYYSEVHNKKILAFMVEHLSLVFAFN